MLIIIYYIRLLLCMSLVLTAKEVPEYEIQLGLFCSRKCYTRLHGVDLRWLLKPLERKYSLMKKAHDV